MERVRQLEDENIILVTNNVKLTEQVVENNRTQTRQLLETMVGRVVIVIDFRDCQSDFQEILKIVRSNLDGNRRDLNQRTYTIFVGKDSRLELVRNSMLVSQGGGLPVPYFAELEPALEAARHYLSQAQTKNNLL